MLKVNINVAKDLKSAIVKLSGEGTTKVSEIKDDVFNGIASYIADKQPNYISFESDNGYSSIIDQLNKLNIKVDSDGVVMHPSKEKSKYDVCYNTIEKLVDGIESFDLIVNEEDDYTASQLLLDNGYIISYEKEGGKVKFHIHGKNS